MNSSSRIFQIFSSLGVNYCTCVAGGGIMYLVDAVSENANIKTKYFHHEQAAGFAAEGYAKATSMPAVCLVTIGPGVANAVASALSSYLNSTAVIFVSGAKRTSVASEYKVNRFSFPQDADTRSMVSSLVKGFWEITNTAQIDSIIYDAVELATSGRPGPVWISVPLDIQAKQLEGHDQFAYYRPRYEEELLDISNVVHQFLTDSLRTVILTGDGASHIISNPGFKSFLERINLPVVTTIGSNHTITHAGELNLGSIGPFGRRAANRIFLESDSVIVIGCGLDVDMTGFDRQSFFNGKKFLVVNPDPNLYFKEASSVIYVRAKSQQINYALLSTIATKQDKWSSYSRKVNRLLSIELEHKLSSNPDDDFVDPYLFALKLGESLPDKTALSTGISLDIVSISHSIRLKKDTVIYVSKHCGQLGWDIPATVGILDSSQHEHVICVTGDGSLMFNLQELATLSFTPGNVHVFIYDNKGYNSIRVAQHAHLAGKIHGSDERDLKFPKWDMLAKSFNFDYFEINNNDQIDGTLKKIFTGSKTFCVVSIAPDRNRTPRLVSKISDGRFVSPSLADQYPLLPSDVVDDLDNLRCMLQ